MREHCHQFGAPALLIGRCLDVLFVQDAGELSLHMLPFDCVGVAHIERLAARCFQFINQPQMFVAHLNLRLQAARGFFPTTLLTSRRYHSQMPGTKPCEVLLAQVDRAGSLTVPGRGHSVARIADDGR